MALGLLGILGLGGVGAGIAGGLGYGFGIRYGFERIFPAFQTGGTKAAIQTAASDIASLLGTQGFDAGAAETDTFLGDVPDEPPPSRRGPSELRDVVKDVADDVFTRVTAGPTISDTADPCRRLHQRLAGLIKLQIDTQKRIQQLSRRRGASTVRILGDLQRQRGGINTQINAITRDSGNVTCLRTFKTT